MEGNIMNDKITWVIEKGLFPEYENKLINEIRKSGNYSFIIDDNKHYNEIEFQDMMDEQFLASDIVMFYGSLQLGRRMLRNSYYPGIYLTLPNYETYRYYSSFGNELLNSDYIMFPLNDVMRNLDIVRNRFPISHDKNHELFIRPTNGFKSFAGQMISIHNFTNEFDLLCKSYGGLSMDDLVILSSSKNIAEEYRFVIVDGEVITGSIYFDSENIGTHDPHYDKVINLIDDKHSGLLEYVNSVKNNYIPDKSFTLDITKLQDGTYKVIEINSFCCASLYGCDLSLVVEAMNKLILSDYNDIYN